MAELCALNVHPRTPENTTSAGRCIPCQTVRRKRKRAADRGAPLCWTATHPEPAEGHVCECGQAPPVETWVDWALVSDIVSGRSLFRPMTTGEEVCAVATVAARYGGGIYEAGTWLGIDEKRVEYLFTRWAPANNFTPRSVNESLSHEIDTAEEYAAA